MAISFVGSTSASSANSNGGTSTQSVTMPTVSANDLAIIVLSRDLQESFTATPTGFTQHQNVNVGSQNATIWYKVLAGTEGGSSFTASWTTSGYNAMGLVVYRGVDPTAPFNVTTTTGTDTGNNSSQTFPAITTVTPNCWIVYVLADVKTTATSAGQVHTQPSGATERVDVASARNNTLNAGVGISDLIQTSAGTVSSTTGSTDLPVYDATFTIALGPQLILESAGAIATGEAVGTPSANVIQTLGAAGGIATGEALGTPVGNYAGVLFATGIAGAEAVGTPVGSSTVSLTATGIATGEAVGTPATQPVTTLTGQGIDSDEASGTGSISTIGTATVTGIPSGESVPSPRLVIVEESWGFLYVG